MSEQSKLHPLTRFSEFEGDEGWIKKVLGDLGYFTGGGTPSTSNTSYWQGNIPWVSSSDISDDSIHEIQITRFISEEALQDSATKLVPKNSILLVSRVGVGKLAITLEPLCTSQDFTSFTPKRDNLTFLAYYLKSKSNTLLGYSQGMAIKGFTKDDISKLELFIPTEPKEQQKIADCLSSLDDLITAQNQKFEALKQHNKGLMQQLFPAEGETVPKLRFPEFRNDKHWKATRLGDIGSVRMCKRIFKEETTPSGEIPFYKIGTFGGIPDAFISREIFEDYRSKFPFPKKGAVLISAAGTIGRTVIYKGELAYFQDSNIVWLDNDENLIIDNFLFYLYQLINWSPSVGTIQRLYNENILGARIKFPSIPEQKKIAKCLMALDDLITIQTQKIDLLKNLKKGLMQRLFPTFNEVDR